MIHPQFHEALGFAGGLAIVVSDNMIGYINPAGERVPKDPTEHDRLRAEIRSTNQFTSTPVEMDSTSASGVVEHILDMPFHERGWIPACVVSLANGTCTPMHMLLPSDFTSADFGVELGANPDIDPATEGGRRFAHLGRPGSGATAYRNPGATFLRWTGSISRDYTEAGSAFAVSARNGQLYAVLIESIGLNSIRIRYKPFG